MVRRGGIYYLEHPEWGRRPVLVLTRDAAIQVLKRVTIASITRTVRNIPTEVALDQNDGMPGPCVVSLDNLGDVWKAMLSDHITTLAPTRMNDVCQALTVAVGCDSS